MNKLNKCIFTMHRVLGTLLSALFVVWFISGLVMIYHTFPKVTLQEKIEHLFTLGLDRIPIDTVLSVIPDKDVTGIILENNLGQETFSISAGKDSYYINKDLSKYIPNSTPDRIIERAKLWGEGAVKAVDTLYTLDQWVPFGQLKEHFPIYKFYFDDKNSTQIYISSVTGDVLQSTTTGERFWAWAGAIPHWVYFTVIRQDVNLWKDIVIWLSGIGSIMVILGLYTGIFMFVRREKGKRMISPYKRKWYWTHHVLGTVFGIFVLTWVFSGMMSLAGTPKWLGKAHEKYNYREVIRGSGIDVKAYKSDYYSVLDKYSGTRRIEWGRFCDIPIYTLSNGLETIVVDASTPDCKPLLLTENDISQFIVNTCGNDCGYTITLMNDYDCNYISRKGDLPLPVYKIEIADKDGSVFYINPGNGQCRFVNNHSRWSSFLYKGLHSLNFKWLISNPVSWHIVMWILMLGGTVVSFSGVFIGVKYIKRKLTTKL